MTEQAERYDRIADGYARWWGPIIAPAAVTVLDEIDAAVAGRAPRLVDVGTGTGHARDRGDPALAGGPGHRARRLVAG